MHNNGLFLPNLIKILLFMECYSWGFGMVRVVEAVGASVRERKEDGGAGYHCVCVSYIQIRKKRKQRAKVMAIPADCVPT